MRWNEPLTTVKGRERLFNRPGIMVPIMLGTAMFVALVCALCGCIAIRVRTGSWHWPLSALISAAFGGFIGLVISIQQRVRFFPQEIELRSEDFSVRDTHERQMRYDQLRAFSLVQPTRGGTVYRLLMLYPRTGRAFSIGIPEDVTDEQIHACLRDHAPFATIIDDEALKPNF